MTLFPKVWFHGSLLPVVLLMLDIHFTSVFVCVYSLYMYSQGFLFRHIFQCVYRVTVYIIIVVDKILKQVSFISG